MSYTITPSSTAVNEGDTVTFTVATFGVATGTTLYWTTTGTVSGADFSDGVTSGSFITTGNSTTFTRTITQDSSFESAETFAIQLRITSTSGEIVSTSDTVTISDRRYTVVPSSSTVDEGTSLSFSVSTVNVSNGTLYWSINHITTSAADFFAVNGSFSITSSAGTFSITTIADLSTESGETFTVSVRVGSTSGTVVATSSTVTITDTSTTPTSQGLYTTAGTYTWVAPAGVTSVSVVAVGGGGGGGSNNGGGGGGGALAYGNNITVVPGASYTVVVGAAGGAGAAGGQSYFSSATFLKAGGGSGGNSGNSNSAGGGGGAGGYSGQGGYAGNSQSATKYAPGIYGTAAGTAMTAGFSGGYGGYGGNTVTSFSAAAVSSSGGSGGGGRGTNGGAAQDGGGVGILGEGASGANPIASSGSGNPNPFVVNGGSGGNDGSTSTASGMFGGGGGGASGAGGGGAVRIIWPGDVRYFPSTRTDDEPTPSGTFTFTTTPTTMAENVTGNFIVSVSGTPQLKLYWTIKHGTTVAGDFVATSGSFTTLASNTIAITPTISGGITDRTFQLEIRINSTSGTVVATSSIVSLLITGQQTFTTIGTNTFTVPDGVTSISIVAVGGGGGGGDLYAGGAGGGLGYKNNYSVSPGQTFTVQVGDYGRSPNQGYTNGGDSYFNNATVVKGGGGTRGQTLSPVPAGGTYVGDGGGNGGAGGTKGSDMWGCGGGAGGYAGNGGAGGISGGSGSGGGGGGGAHGTNTTAYGGAGGGVGLLGQGTNGVGATFGSYSGSGGSGGDPGSSTQYYYNGGLYGGGGGGASIGSGVGRGAQGAVRVIWPGTLRQFPTTNTGSF